MRFLVPQGIGDSLWAMTKMQAIAKDHGENCIDVYLACSNPNCPIESRALPFVRRFEFVRFAEMMPVPILLPGDVAEDGYYRYHGDGWDKQQGLDVFWLVPNAPLERGQRLESWLPHHETRWDIAKDFMFKTSEIQEASDQRSSGKFACFYLGPLAGNTSWGHNRGPMWTPDDWRELARMCIRQGIQPVAVGSDWDRPYFEQFAKGGLFYDAVGKWGIGQTFAVCREAEFVIGYQSGIPIFSVYLGVPTATWWRPRGDTVSPHGFVSFDEGMASAWAEPGAVESGRYLPMIYGRSTPESIMAHAKEHWIR